MNSSDFGRMGEEMAADYLLSQAYDLLDKNWYFNKKELDLIFENSDYIVFVEVKSRQDTTLEDPTKAITKSKKRFLLEAANAYILENDIEKEARFDVITILLDEKGAPTLKHYENAIIPEI